MFTKGYELHRETAGRVTCRKRGVGGSGFALEILEGLVGKPENGEKVCRLEKPGYKIA